jgi:pyruvate/2-oxoglutarate/acetoin dehydrogenase E1 component
MPSYAEALVEAIHDGLAADARVSLIGSHLLGLGPQRRLMDRIRKDFPDRVVDPPIAEAGVAAAGIGAAMAGMRPLVDFGTGSFSYLAWSQITNEAAVSCYMSNGRIPVPVTFHLLGCAAAVPRSTAAARNRCCATRRGWRSSRRRTPPTSTD